MLVQPLNVAAQHGLGAKQPPSDELRQIRVIEARERDAAALRHEPAGPGRVEDVARLDQRRLQRIEQPRPTPRIERQAVVEGPGHRVTRQRAHAAALDVRLAAGHHDGVFPRGVCREPGVLRREVALHAAAGRRIKQSRVDEMHGWFFARTPPKTALHLYDSCVSSVGANPSDWPQRDVGNDVGVRSVRKRTMQPAPKA